MSVFIKRLREAASFISGYVLPLGITGVDTTNFRWIVGDGVTAGGWPAAKLAEVLTIAGSVRQSWTPSLKFGGASVGMTYATQSGTYVQINKLLVCEFLIVLTAKGSSTGAATIGGLPVTSDADSGLCAVTFYQNMASMSALSNYISGSSTTINLAAVGATAVAALTEGNFTNTSILYGNAIYLAP